MFRLPASQHASFSIFICMCMYIYIYIYICWLGPPPSLPTSCYTHIYILDIHILSSFQPPNILLYTELVLLPASQHPAIHRYIYIYIYINTGLVFIPASQHPAIYIYIDMA